MTVADRTEGHQACCRPHLLTLRMLAIDDAEAPPVAGHGQGSPATDAILAEVEDRGPVRSGPRRGAARALASS